MSGRPAPTPRPPRAAPGASRTGPGEPVGGDPAGRGGLLGPVLVMATARAAALVVVAAATRVTPPVHFVGALGRWDAGWYLWIARDGYPDGLADLPSGQSRLAFFPLWPAVLRASAAVTGMALDHAAVVATFAAAVVAAVAVHRWAEGVVGPAAAAWTVALWSFFPGTVALTLAYAEGLALAAAAVALGALHRRRWFLAGVAGAVATATRVDMVAVVVAAAVAAAVAVRRDRRWAALAAPVLAAVGVTTHVVFVAVRTGRPGGWLDVQRAGWDNRFDGGLRAVRNLIDAVSDPGASLQTTVNAAGLVVTVVLVAFFVRWRPPAPVVAYVATVLVTGVGATAVTTRPRLVLVAFPLFAAAGRWLAARDSRAVGGAVACAVSAMMLGALTWLVVTTRLVTP